MKKILLLLLSLILVIGIFAGCNNLNEDEVTIGDTESNAIEENSDKETDNEEKENISIKVVSPAGIPTLSIIKMFKENPSLGENVQVDYESINSPDLIASKIISEELDIAIIPTNLAAKLYNKGVNYQLASSNVWGILYVVSSEDLNSWEDLRGKEIYMIGRGLTPDVIFRYLLSKNGLNPEKDVTLNYIGGATELAPTFIADKSTVSIMPEPMLSKVLMKKPETNLVLDLQEEWAESSGIDSSYPQASLFVKKELIENHPEVVEAFLKEYEKSINWLNENPSEAGNYAEELETGLNSEIVQKAMPRANIKFVNAMDSRNAIENYLNVLMEHSAESVGGKLPDDGFYYQR